MQRESRERVRGDRRLRMCVGVVVVVVFHETGSCFGGSVVGVHAMALCSRLPDAGGRRF